LDSSTDYHNSEPSLGVKYCSNEVYSINVMLSIEILRGEIQPVVSEKSGSEDRDKSKLLASLGVLGLSKVRATEQN